MPNRSRRVVLLAHCHLNANTKVHGLADYEGARVDVLGPLLEQGIGIVQLPCPECTFLGLNRWGMTREQYDHRAYREHCARILQPVLLTLVELAADGCSLEAVIGVDGSPSCGVNRTCVGYAGGEIEALAAIGEVPQARDAEQAGVFMEVLKSLLEAEDLRIPFKAFDEKSI